MKKIIENLHHLFGIGTVFLVIFIPMVYFQSITKGGVHTFNDFVQNWNNSWLLLMTISSFFPWLLMIRLAWSYLFNHKK